MRVDISRTIIAEMVDDWVDPYKKMGCQIPVVRESANPRFRPHTRFDYGYLQMALETGWTVIILPKGAYR